MNYRIIKIEDEKTYYDYFDCCVCIVENYLIMVYNNECKDELLGAFPCKDYIVIKID